MFVVSTSVSELYLLIKSLINIERAVDLCVITKKYTAYTGTVSQAWLYDIQAYACCTQAGPAHAAGRGDGIDR